MTEPLNSVFLSYASEDAQAASRICTALRAAGIEVWFDQSELRGGDAWDRSIRAQIKGCGLFIPVISRNAHDRDEGYFRLEWKLAVDRCHLMAADKAFLLPVVIDNTRDDDDRVPERFREVQWTRLPGGETPAAFVERVRRLLTSPLLAVRPSGEATAGPQADSRRPKRASGSTSWRRGLAPVAAVVIVGALAYLYMERAHTPQSVSPPPAPAVPAPVAFTPPPHSIAVLPFQNLSGDKDQEYFSEGLTEELLNALTDINGLQVAGRMSAFSFQGTGDDLATIARKLNVGSILEGSVRRSGHTIRVTAQLINAVTGFEVWSQSYDRDLGDVLKLQTDIATAVAGSLKVTLLGDVSARIELGGTHNPAALDAYLRALKEFQAISDPGSGLPKAIAAYAQAIRLDPHYALAFAARSVAFTQMTAEGATGIGGRATTTRDAEADARQAIALAPNLAQGHLALAYVAASLTFDFALANAEYERASELAPGNAEVLRDTGIAAAFMGRFDTGIAALRRAVVLDPLDRTGRSYLSRALYHARRYAESAAAYTEVIGLYPDYKASYGSRGLALLGLGKLDGARASCETTRDYWVSQWCLAMIYEKLGRHADAAAELAKVKASSGDAGAYQYATIYAQWGDHARALDWLDTAMRLRDPGLVQLKTDPLMDPLRAEPRFQAVLSQLNFPPD